MSHGDFSLALFDLKLFWRNALWDILNMELSAMVFLICGKDSVTVQLGMHFYLVKPHTLSCGSIKNL